MIFDQKFLKKMKAMQAGVIQGMNSEGKKTPYFIRDDEVLKRYEIIRAVWKCGKSIEEICASTQGLSRSSYYEIEKAFIQHGVLGLFTSPSMNESLAAIEDLVVMSKKARPNLSGAALLRIAQAIPCTHPQATEELISDILASHGLSVSSLASDESFFSKLQRIVAELYRHRKIPLNSRSQQERKGTFFIDKDEAHKRLELLHSIFYEKKANIRDLCTQHGISMTSYYRLIDDYMLYGPWAIIPAAHLGKQSGISEETELSILLHKLKHPKESAADIVDHFKLKFSRQAVNRIFKKWKLCKSMTPTSLDEYQALPKDLKEDDRLIKPALHIVPETLLLESRRINRHFELIAKKMNSKEYHICDPGPILLAPFMNDLGIVQAFESYGPTKLRGKELSNPVIINAMRILAGYRCINHLNDNRDHSVALASGIGMFGSVSRFYDNSLEFSFEGLHRMRNDLVARALELHLLGGKQIGLDFHLKEFYGHHSKEKGIGKGPDKAGDMVPAHRPHIAWDLATNVIISIAYYQGAARAPRILREFLEREVFSVLDRRAIEEIYMDSEYTKEDDYRFLQVECKNGHIYTCLKLNPQIQKLIRPHLNIKEGWQEDKEDERKTVDVILPHTKLSMKVVIIRDREKKDRIRCFGSTNQMLSGDEILKKYPSRWTIENGIKDLVHSYFLDATLGYDPQKVEFEFYCIMVARMTYEYFLKELGGEYFTKQDGNKCTLNSMRDLLFEKRNCTLRQDGDQHFVLTFLDCGEDEEIQKELIATYERLSAQGKNKVLWWNNRGLRLEFKRQYPQFSSRKTD